MNIVLSQIFQQISICSYQKKIKFCIPYLYFGQCTHLIAYMIIIFLWECILSTVEPF